MQTISVRFVWPFRTISRQLGLDSIEAWSSFGISQETLSDPDGRIPVDVGQQMITWVIAATGLPDYGLKAAEAAEPGLFDLPEYAARCQPTLLGALQRTISLIPLLSEAVTITVHRQEDFLSVELVPNDRVNLHPVSVEFTFAYLQIAARRFTGVSDLAYRKVRFRHAAPNDSSHHERLFLAPIEFGADVDALVVPVKHLDLPLKLADSRLAVLLDEAGDHLLEKIARRGTFADAVRRLVIKHLASDGAPVTTIARELTITPRTLHRRLAEESTTFRDLADDVRKGLALAYMERRELAVSEIAYLLGFSGVQAFHRAFKRWTEQTPGAFRATARR